uniref:Uncharacterized protein n=1 Tax=Pyrodinium bahamense TaxID=73915 RepID=A0A7R9ZX32_9DINO
MGGDKKKRSERSRSPRKEDEERKRRKSRSRSRKKSRSQRRSASQSKRKKVKDGSKKKSGSVKGSGSEKNGEAKKRGDSGKRSRSRKRSASGKKSGSKKRSASRKRSASKKKSRSRRRSGSRKRAKTRKSRSRSRRKSRSRSGSKSGHGGSTGRRRPRSSGFDQREPVPESLLSEVQMVVPVMGPPPKEPNPEVEAFLAMNPVEPHAANQLRGLPPHLQRVVLARGSLMSARDRSAVLTSRISDALTGRYESAGCPPLPSSGLGMPAPLPNIPGMSHPGIEALIARYNLDARCAAMLRMLPPDKQARAAELPVHEARNPSAFVMAQIQLLFGWRSGLAPTPTPPPALGLHPGMPPLG